jgi:hypothetical protein
VLAIALLAPCAALAGPPAPSPNAPSVDSTLPAGNVDNAGSVDFTFTSEDPDATFQCALDSAPIDVCDSITSYTDLPEGNHTLTVEAVDASDNVSNPTVVHFTEDYTAPAAPSIHGPAAATSDPDATLTFSGEPGGSFQCSFDGSDFAPCTSPVAEPALADGDHELDVQQTDAADNVGAVGAYDWSVDTVAPDAPALSTAVPAVSAATSATFDFSGEPGGVFQCALNGAPFATCTSPVTYAGLTAGFDELVVQQVDDAGNVGNQAIYDWQENPPPAPKPPVQTPAITAPVPVPVVPAVPVLTPRPVVPHAPAVPVTPTVPHVAKPTSCVSRRTLTVHWRVPRGEHTGAPQVLIDGRVVQTLKPAARSALIRLAGRPKTVVHVIIRAHTTGGRLVQTARTYATCVAKSDHAAVHTMVLH